VAKRWELVIFDCDGILVDSEPAVMSITAEMVSELGWQLSEGEAARRFLGRSDEFMIAEIEAYLGRALPDGWAAEYDDRCRLRLEAELKPVQGIFEALVAIEAPVCVASSGSPAKIRTSLMLTGLYEYFRGRIFSARDVGEGKPAPDLFLYAAARMGADPAATAVIEDSPSGIEAARRAGMVPLAYTGGTSWTDLQADVDAVRFDDMRELPALLRP
jgi:HAD superfamily hydrolase (TIGR01509 family)